MCGNINMYRLFLRNRFISKINVLNKSDNVTNNLCTNVTRNIHLFKTASLNTSKISEDKFNESSFLKKPSKAVEELLENSALFQDQTPQTEEQVWSTAPYPKDVTIPRTQASHALRPNIDPKETSIILFPGQGSQYVGMGKEVAEVPIVRDMFEHASEILGYDLFKLCMFGPKEELDKTVHCQLAVMVCSLAAVELLRDNTPNVIERCIATAGFSVGEITALTFAGVLSFERAIKLVKVRGEAMQLASEMEPGGMMTVLYGPNSKLNEACKRAKEWAVQMGVEKPICSIANYLFPDCKVIAGHNQALEFIEKNLKQFKLRRVKRLPVSGAFHTSLMDPAVQPFQVALEKVKLEQPVIAVHSNVTGKMYKNATQIKSTLPRQIVLPVKWEQILHILYERPDGENFPSTYECGPGNSLKTILKMVNLKAANFCKNVGS